MQIRNYEEKIVLERINCQKEIEQFHQDAQDIINKEFSGWSKQYEDAWAEKLRLESEIKEVLIKVTIFPYKCK